MEIDQINNWIQDWMDLHSDSDNSDVLLDNSMMRIGAVSILQFARDAGLITQEEFQRGMNPIVSRTHPQLGEVYSGSYKKTVHGQETSWVAKCPECHCTVTLNNEKCMPGSKFSHECEHCKCVFPIDAAEE